MYFTFLIVEGLEIKSGCHNSLCIFMTTKGLIKILYIYMPVNPIQTIIPFRTPT